MSMEEENKRFYNSIGEIQVGDYAFVDNTRVIVDSITPTGRINVSGVKDPRVSHTFNANGNSVGGDRWTRVHGHLEPYSEENYKAWREKNLRNNFSSFIKTVPWADLPTEDLKEIWKLIAEKLKRE